MAYIQSVTVKRGATFSYAGLVNLPGDFVWSANSNIRDRTGAVIQTLDVTLAEPLPDSDQWRILLTATPEDTLAWPIGTLYWDIRYINEFDSVIISPTISVFVVESETYA